MDPIRFAIDNSVKVTVGVILIVLFGLLSLRIIPVQLTPNVDRPIISVTTHWEGASPEEIENDVIRPQEDKLKSIAGLRKMSSFCRLSEGQIVLEFPVGTDKDAALREASEKLRQVPDYPDNVDEPVVEASDPNNRDYIAWVIFSTSDPDFDVRHLQKWADDNIKTELERVLGISEVNVLGGSEPEIQIAVDPLKLAQFHISPARLAAVLRNQNLNASAGDIQEGKLNVRLRAVGRYVDTQEIADTVISLPDEPVVRVADVADVTLGYKEPFAIVRSKGVRSLAINAQREVGSNVMAVMAGFREAIDRLNRDVLPDKARDLDLDGDLTLRQVYDQTVYIEQAIDLVLSNLMVGGALAVMVLLAFLRSFKFTLIVALAIPISVIGTFAAMVAMGRNLNVISLAGLAFAVGMVLDNAIVVLENIDRHRRGLHEKPFLAAYSGTKEVWGAVLASTATTLAVFLPVLTIQEEAGQLFRDIALAICAAVTLSLVVSVLVIPVAASRLIGSDQVKPHGRFRTLFESAFGLAPLAGRFNDLFSRTIHAMLGSWPMRLTITVVFVVVALVGSAMLMPPTTYLPTGNRNLVFALLIPPPGYNLDKQLEIGERIEAVVEPYWQAQPGTPEADALPPVMSFDFATGQMRQVQPAPVDNFFFVGLNNGLMFSGAISSDDRKVNEAGALLNSVVTRQPGVIGFATKLPLINTGNVGNGIELEISGPRLDQINTIAEAVFIQLMQMKEFQQARPDPGNFNIPAEEVQVRRDMIRAADLGVSNADLGTMVRMLGDGAIVGEYIYEGDGIDIKILANNQQPDSATYVADVPIAAGDRQIVPISSIADIIRTTAPQQINRIETQRSVTIQIELPDDVPLDTGQQMIQNQIIAPMRAAGQIPDAVSVNIAGTAAKLRDVRAALLGEWQGFTFESLMSLLTSRAFLALLVVFLVMAALFEAWLYPFVIMLTVPLATVGGFLGLRLVHTFVPDQQLDVLTMLGFVILIGIIVNNAILIVHQALNFMRGQAETEKEGEASREPLAPRQAITESVKTRMRPIFMSTLTSVGGMLPLVVFPGAGSELYRGLGSVVVGGLLIGTCFTLLLVPAVMSMVVDVQGVIARLIRKQGS
jgi:HAE1 family hydrophobic/amphiphilic exporter-1